MNPMVSAFKLSPLLLATYVFAVVLGFPVQSGATAQDKPAQFIKGLADEAIAILSNREGSLDER
ncbi:MAG: hypothetical protein VX075_13115, partial [Pseudomonadota bacterium]|nr:hypothetical protein [Pseudomonadota bacterium]